MVEQYAKAKNVFWIASFSGVILNAIYIMASTQITSIAPTDLGLLTKLPIVFWIGIAYLLALLYIGRKSELRTVVVTVLIFLYLFAIPTMIKETKAIAIPYYWSSLGEQLPSKGYIDFSALYSVELRNWPAYFFITAFLTSTTGLPAKVFVDFFPLLTVTLLGLMAYSILKLRLNTLYSSLGTLWWIGCLWVGQQYFMPQSIALMLYFAIFLLMAKLFFGKSRLKVEITLILLFTVLVATHLLSTFFVLLATVGVYVLSKAFPRQEKMPRFFSIVTSFLLVSIFFAYEFLITQRSSSDIVRVVYEQLVHGDSTLSTVGLTVSGNRVFGSASYLIQVVSSYAITILNVVVAALALLTIAVGLLRHKKVARLDRFWIAWIMSAGVLGLTIVYGPEAINRAFLFAILPISYFAARFLGKRPRFLIVILAAIVLLSIPAQYCQENYVYIPSTESKGIAFYSMNAPGNESFFYEHLNHIEVRNGSGKQLSTGIAPTFMAKPEVFNSTIWKAKFIIYSDSERNYYRYFHGVDPLQNLGLDYNFSRAYDNGGFQIYAR